MLHIYIFIEFALKFLNLAERLTVDILMQTLIKYLNINTYKYLNTLI